MKTLLIAFLLLSGLSASAQDYFVAFFGEKIIGSPSLTGHAFIGIGKGIPMTCSLDGSETQMWGFYPKVHIEGGKSLWAGPVDGKLVDDIRTHINYYYFKKIEFADYIKVQLKVEEWKKKRYQLTRQDCISFFADVAGLFTDIQKPDRTKFMLPETYVQEFIRINHL